MKKLNSFIKVLERLPHGEYKLTSAWVDGKKYISLKFKYLERQRSAISAQGEDEDSLARALANVMEQEKVRHETQVGKDQACLKVIKQLL